MPAQPGQLSPWSPGGRRSICISPIPSGLSCTSCRLAALHREADRRALALPPRFAVPDRAPWETGYRATAARARDLDAPTLDDALHTVRPFLDPLLDRTAHGRWDPHPAALDPPAVRRLAPVAGIDRTAAACCAHSASRGVPVPWLPVSPCRPSNTPTPVSRTAHSSTHHRKLCPIASSRPWRSNRHRRGVVVQRAGVDAEHPHRGTHHIPERLGHTSCLTDPISHIRFRLAGNGMSNGRCRWLRLACQHAARSPAWH